jgi:hypothetical protein
MPALFAYIIAVVVLVGGGYAGLQWLAEPEPVPVATHAGKQSSKELSKKLSESRKVAEQARLPADVEGPDSHVRGSVSTDAQSKPAAEAVDPQTTGDASRSSQLPTDPNSAKDVADVPRGGCMPFGITGKGELVFPMECQAILTQYGAGRKAPQADPDESAAASTPTQAEPAEHSEAAQPSPKQEASPLVEPSPDGRAEDVPTDASASAKSDQNGTATDTSTTQR